MSETSPRLDLPYLQASQAQKHVTHNEALKRLDTLTQLVVEGFAAETPPVAPVPGEVHALGALPTGAWAGQAGTLAAWDGVAWGFVAPKTGWRAWGRAEAGLRVFDGADWVAADGDHQDLDGVGIGTAWDASNRLAVASEASLFTHDGAGHQVKVNKAATAETASLLFQTAFSGRAEMGLAGDDDFAIKVSADGAVWTEALAFDKATGRVGGAAVQASLDDATSGRLMLNGAHGLGNNGRTRSDLTVDLPSGFYNFAEATAVGSPGTLAYNCALVVDRSSSGTMFLAWRQTSNPAAMKMWLGSRAILTGAITWVEVYHRTNLLGTVSQSGGVPTGALIEEGSNGNGRYLRFADGTQLCRRVAAAVAASDTALTLPAAFIDTSYAVLLSNANASARMMSVGSKTTATFVPQMWDTAGARVAGTVDFLAVGRWF